MNLLSHYQQPPAAPTVLTKVPGAGRPESAADRSERENPRGAEERGERSEKGAKQSNKTPTRASATAWVAGCRCRLQCRAGGDGTERNGTAEMDGKLESDETPVGFPFVA